MWILVAYLLHLTIAGSHAPMQPLMKDNTLTRRLRGDAQANAMDQAGGCNGYVEYCPRRISQVLWIGAHNALTDKGFALQRNQFASGSQLLDAGVRYFDIDTCVYDLKGKRHSPMICHGTGWYLAQLYQSTADGLKEIKQWLDLHQREVIFLNFGDIGDFTIANSDGVAPSSETLRADLVNTARLVFGNIAVLRNDPFDDKINSDEATLQDLLDANRRVIVNIGHAKSQSEVYWGQSDRVCRHSWYVESLKMNADQSDYDWTPVMEDIENTMRKPCAQAPQLLNKLEFEFHTALGNAIDAKSVGDVLDAYMAALHERNVGNSPYFPFNLILTDHSDKWAALYTQWHAIQLSYLKDH